LTEVINVRDTLNANDRAAIEEIERYGVLNWTFEHSAFLIPLYQDTIRDVHLPSIMFIQSNDPKERLMVFSSLGSIPAVTHAQFEGVKAALRMRGAKIYIGPDTVEYNGQVGVSFRASVPAGIDIPRLRDELLVILGRRNVIPDVPPVA
jgi:hypothetical protein